MGKKVHNVLRKTTFGIGIAVAAAVGVGGVGAALILMPEIVIPLWAGVAYEAIGGAAVATVAAEGGAIAAEAGLIAEAGAGAGAFTSTTSGAVGALTEYTGATLEAGTSGSGYSSAIARITTKEALALRTMTVGKYGATLGATNEAIYGLEKKPSDLFGDAKDLFNQQIVDQKNSITNQIDQSKADLNDQIKTNNDLMAEFTRQQQELLESQRQPSTTTTSQTSNTSYSNAYD